MTTWFCDAYASWQKGGVENTNGRLRRWLPRQIDIDKVYAIDVVLHRGRPAQPDRSDNLSVHLDGKPATP